MNDNLSSKSIARTYIATKHSKHITCRAIQISARYSRGEGLLALLALPGRCLGLLELVALLPVQGLELLLVLRLEVVHGCVY